MRSRPVTTLPITAGLAASLAMMLGLAADDALALPSARVFVNVKVAVEAEREDAPALADSYCTSHGFAKAGSYENPLVVRSERYVRFAVLRCLKAAEERAAQ